MRGIDQNKEDHEIFENGGDQRSVFDTQHQKDLKSQ